MDNNYLRVRNIVKPDCRGPDMDYGIVVHGGAWNIPDNVKEDHLNGVEAACQLGWELLGEGKSAIDIIEQVVSLMEDDPTFDAGKGSHLNAANQVEMDAIIASDNYQIGSVCAIQHVKNPILVARLVRDKTEHLILVGDGATDFALSNGITKCSEEELLVGRERERYLRLKDDLNYSTKNPFRNAKKQGFGTVGAVVKDTFGKIAIGVSTGGTPMKLPGRVGDTPLWGAGGYVIPEGGCAATGFGEDLIKVLMSQRVVSHIQMGKTAQQAADIAISDLHRLVKGLGGVITLDHRDIGIAFNTPRMAFSFRTTDRDLFTGIEKQDLDIVLNS